MPNSITIDQSETTEQIILIGFNSNVDTNQFASCFSTCLLYRECLTVTRQSSNECWIEYFGLDYLVEIIEIAKRNICIVHRRHHSYSVCSRRCFVCLLQFLNTKVPLSTSCFVCVQTTACSTIRKTHLTSNNFYFA